MKEANPENTDDFMMFSRKMIIDGELVTGRGPGAGADNIGRITKERFAPRSGNSTTSASSPKARSPSNRP